MAIYGLTLFHAANNIGVSKYGWTETWFVDRGTFNAARTVAENLVRKRAQLSANGAYIEAYRIQDVAVPKDGQVFYAGKDGVNQLATGETDMPFTSLLIRLFAVTAGHKANKYLRGIPDDLVMTIFPGSLEVNETYQLAWDAFKTFITENGLGWLSFANPLTPNPTPPPPNLPRTDFTKVFRNAVSLEMIRITRRATGRPSFLPVGRRKKKKVVAP